MGNWKDEEMNVDLITTSSFHTETKSSEKTTKGKLLEEIERMKNSSGLYKFSTILYDLKGGVTAKGEAFSLKGKILFTIQAKRMEVHHGNS